MTHVLIIGHERLGVAAATAMLRECGVTIVHASEMDRATLEQLHRDNQPQIPISNFLATIDMDIPQIYHTPKHDNFITGKKHKRGYKHKRKQ